MSYHHEDGYGWTNDGYGGVILRSPRGATRYLQGDDATAFINRVDEIDTAHAEAVEGEWADGPITWDVSDEIREYFHH